MAPDWGLDRFALGGTAHPDALTTPMLETRKQSPPLFRLFQVPSHMLVFIPV
jgi:hypothetical protein